MKAVHILTFLFIINFTLACFDVLYGTDWSLNGFWVLLLISLLLLSQNENYNWKFWQKKHYYRVTLTYIPKTGYKSIVLTTVISVKKQSQILQSRTIKKALFPKIGIPKVMLSNGKLQLVTDAYLGRF